VLGEGAWVLASGVCGLLYVLMRLQVGLLSERWVRCLL
jgi:hypothetical protein